MSFADTSVPLTNLRGAPAFAVDPNQEMTALRVASGLFQGFPISSSSSRTPVAELRREVAVDGCCRRARRRGAARGTDDNLGSVNLITAETRRRASRLAQQGLTVSLAHNPLTDKADDNAAPFEHTMNRGFTTDTYRVSYHGYAHSHLDALCHILYKDQTFNGYARETVNTEKGCARLGIEHLKQGIVTRGVLLDIPG